MKKLDKWRCYGRDKELIKNILEPTLSNNQGKVIKENTERIVKIIDASIITKLDKPSTLCKKLRSRFSSKVQAEYETGIMLEENGIPVVHYIGWAQNGSQGILASELFENSYSATEFWFGEVLKEKYPKKKFLSELAVFLKTFFSANCSHPDFHLGNVLFQPGTRTFKLVDVYGIKKHDSLSENQKYDLHRFLFSLRNGLSTSELCDFIQSCKIKEAPNQAVTYLNLIENTEVTVKKKNWIKRQRQIERNFSKFVTVTNNKDILIRNNFDRKPLLEEDSEELKQRRRQYRAQQCSLEDAKRIWERSFYLSFMAIPHVQPIIFEKISNSIATLYFNHPEEEHSPIKTIDEMINRCTLAGVSTNNLKDTISNNGQGLVLLDIQKVN